MKSRIYAVLSPEQRAKVEQMREEIQISARNGTGAQGLILVGALRDPFTSPPVSHAPASAQMRVCA